MMGDDGAGPLLASRLTENPIEGWQVIDGGSTPENVVHQIRHFNPSLLLIVDATEMGLKPGEIRFIDPDMIAELFLMNTHNMPLNFLIDQLKEDISNILFLGIQPDIVGFYYPMTEAVKEGVEKIYLALNMLDIKEVFDPLVAEDEDSDLLGGNYEPIY